MSQVFGTSVRETGCNEVLRSCSNARQTIYQKTYQTILREARQGLDHLRACTRPDQGTVDAAQSRSCGAEVFMGLLQLST